MYGPLYITSCMARRLPSITEDRLEDLALILVEREIAVSLDCWIGAAGIYTTAKTTGKSAGKQVILVIY